MCQNINNVYFKFAIATLVATVLGIIAGIVWPEFFTNFPTLLLIELITVAVVLVILGVYLLTRGTRGNQSSSFIVYYIRFLLFATIGSFVFSVIALSTTLTASLVSAIIFGIAVGFFVLTIIAIIFLFDYLLKNAL